MLFLLFIIGPLVDAGIAEVPSTIPNAPCTLGTRDYLYLEMLILGTEVGFEPTIPVLETGALDRTKLHGIIMERIVIFELTPYGLEGRHTTFVLYPQFGAP
jgi:hypothetical protein